LQVQRSQSSEVFQRPGDRLIRARPCDLRVALRLTVPSVVLRQVVRHAGQRGFGGRGECKRHRCVIGSPECIRPAERSWHTSAARIPTAPTHHICSGATRSRCAPECDVDRGLSTLSHHHWWPLEDETVGVCNSTMVIVHGQLVRCVAHRFRSGNCHSAGRLSVTEHSHERTAQAS
jgi:hypothetical protein